jgi:hypothetical protein
VGAPIAFSNETMLARITLAPGEFDFLPTTPWPLVKSFGLNWFIDVVRVLGRLKVTASTLSQPSTLQIVPYDANSNTYGAVSYYNDTLFGQPTGGVVPNTDTIQPFIQAPNLINNNGNLLSPFRVNNSIMLTATENDMYPVNNDTHLQLWVYYRVLWFDNTTQGFNLN